MTSSLPTHAVVLAGGLGTRIRDALGDTPKALADIAGRAFIDRKLDELARNGVTQAILLLGHESHQIQEHLARREQGPRLANREDGPVLLGTGGALLNVIHELPDEFYLTYGDSLLDMPYDQLDQQRDRVGTTCALAVTAAVGPADRPNCKLKDGRVVRHSKQDTTGMTATDYGVMLFTREAVEAAARGTSVPLDLSEILGRMAETGELAAATTTEPYWEIGTPTTLDRVRDHFRRSD